MQQRLVLAEASVGAHVVLGRGVARGSLRGRVHQVVRGRVGCARGRRRLLLLLLHAEHAREAAHAAREQVARGGHDGHVLFDLALRLDVRQYVRGYLTVGNVVETHELDLVRATARAAAAGTLAGVLRRVGRRVDLVEYRVLVRLGEEVAVAGLLGGLLFREDEKKR